MAGRIRTIKPEILENERTAGLPDDAWRLFVSLLLLADDHGNMYAAPERIAGHVFWAHPSRDTREALATLSRAGLVQLYELRGQAYLHIIGWTEHQKVDKPGRPRVPGPTTDGAVTILEIPGLKFARPSRDPRETLGNDLDHIPVPPTKITDQDHRPADSGESPGVVQPSFALVASSASPPKFDFEAVYKAHWIRKEGKQDGMAICEKDIRSQGDFEQWTKAVKNYVALMLAERREILRQKHFSSFMAVWRDYVDITPPAGVMNAASAEKGRSLF